jgi:hemolysin activation/secretion protein
MESWQAEQARFRLPALGAVLGAFLLTSCLAVSAWGQAKEWVPPDPCPAVAARLRLQPGGTVEVSRIDVGGNTVFTADALRPLVAGYEGRPLSAAEVCNVADLLQKHYQTGYPYAQVRLAEPGVRDGVLTLQVLEGQVKDLVIQGNDRYSDAYVRSRLHEMAPARPRRGFEEGVVLLNSTPGLQAQVAVQPATTGDSLFDVTA